MYGIVSAMKYLHENKIIHQDLKPTNILIDDDFYPRVCDFGFSRSFPNSIIQIQRTIRVGNWGSQNDYPKSWNIEGSCDGSIWFKLDNQEDCPYLNDPNSIYTFTIENSKEVRFLRIVETGPTWDNSFYLQIESFEIYGTIK